MSETPRPDRDPDPAPIPNPDEPAGSPPPPSAAAGAYPPPPTYGAPGGYQPQVAPGPGSAESRQWGMFAHLSAIVASFVGLPFIGPLIVWLVRKDSDPYVAAHGAEALNANISYSIYMVVATVVTVILSFLLIGFLLIPVLALAGVGWLVLSIIAGIKANNGEFYRYPLVIRFVK